MENRVKNQEIVYQTLEHAFNRNELSHAILLRGNKSDFRKEVAYFIAQSIVCKSKGIACGTCETCIRIKENNYADLIYIDGRVDSIKKADIEYMQHQFSKSAMEAEDCKIYIIDHIENSSIEAINSLLKVLEEPTKRTYAIFTTDNYEAVLPTIVSRVQVMTLRNYNMSEKLELITSKGISMTDAYILSNIYDDVDLIEEQANDDTYKHIKDTAIKVFKQYYINNEMSYVIVHEFLKKNQDKNSVNRLIRILYLIYKESLFIQKKPARYFNENKDLLQSINQKEQKILEKMTIILDYEGKLRNSNMNIHLLMDSLLNHLMLGGN